MTHSHFDTVAIGSALRSEVDALASMLFPERRIVTNGQEIRIGQHGSISIDRQEGVFFDHEVG